MGFKARAGHPPVSIMCHPKRGTGLDKSEAGDRVQVTVTSLLLNKLAKQDLVILVLFLVALGL